MNIDLGIYATPLLTLLIAYSLAVRLNTSAGQRVQAAPDHDKANQGGLNMNEETGPISQLVNRIIEDAYVSSATNIYIEPQELQTVVRYRIAGICRVRLRLQKDVGPRLVRRLKLMSDLDIAQSRLPQEGQIDFKRFTRRNIDLALCVITTPLYEGEGAAIRLFTPVPKRRHAVLPS